MSYLAQLIYRHKTFRWHMKKLACSTCHMIRILLAIYQIGSISLNLLLFHSALSLALHLTEMFRKKPYTNERTSRKTNSTAINFKRKEDVDNNSSNNKGENNDSAAQYIAQEYMPNKSCTCKANVMSKRHINENGLQTKAHCFLSNYQTNLSFHIQIVCQNQIEASTDLTNDSEIERNETTRWRWAEQNREPSRSIQTYNRICTQSKRIHIEKRTKTTQIKMACNAMV